MSSRRALRRRQCGRKRAYADQRQASLHCPPGTIPYRCRWCGRFHVGHPPAHIADRLFFDPRSRLRWPPGIR